MTDENYGYNQAAAQMRSVKDMVAALECDYDRLEELREEHKTLQDAVIEARDKSDDGETEEDEEDELLENLANARRDLEEWELSYSAELRDLEEEAGECENAEDARERIQEDALSVEVRSDWQSPGEELEATEYRIVLCTGGPYVGIRGDLDQYGQPSSARLDYADWGTRGTYFGNELDEDALISYAQQFYFGE